MIFIISTFSLQEQVWGMAYLVAEEDIPHVREYLDFREKGGYSLTSVTFYPRDTTIHQPFEVMIYIATPDNRNYLGPAAMEDIAQQISIPTIIWWFLKIQIGRACSTT